MHQFSVTLSFVPKRLSDRTQSDECLGAKLRVTENRCVPFNSLTYVYIYIYIHHPISKDKYKFHKPVYV